MYQELKEQLSEPTDFDVAMFELGKILGHFEPETSFQDVKYLIWTNSELGKELIQKLRSLESEGYLVYIEDQDKFVWSGKD